MKKFFKWDNAICSNMDLIIHNQHGDYHTKWSSSDREREILYNITDVWNLKYDTNELIYETERNSQT